MFLTLPRFSSTLVAWGGTSVELYEGWETCCVSRSVGALRRGRVRPTGPAGSAGQGRAVSAGQPLDGRRKSMQPMAERLAVDHQQLQQFMTSSTWPVDQVRAPVGVAGRAARAAAGVGGRNRLPSRARWPGGCSDTSPSRQDRMDLLARPNNGDHVQAGLLLRLADGGFLAGLARFGFARRELP